MTRLARGQFGSDRIQDVVSEESPAPPLLLCRMEHPFQLGAMIDNSSGCIELHEKIDV
jgi:hypothetical protein